MVIQSDETPAEEDLGPSCCCDKSKSFFDNVSSEFKSHSRWVTWGEERKLTRRPWGSKEVPAWQISGRDWQGLNTEPGFLLKRHR